MRPQGCPDHHPAATRTIVLIVVLLLLFLCASSSLAGAEEQSSSKPCRFPAIFNFGDSNSDTGGISAVFYPIVMPYGQTFFGKAVGRASDGRLMVDFFAESLGLPYLSAYLNSVGANYHHGANFATGSSTIMMPNETFFKGGRSPFNLQIQIAQFIQFKTKALDPDTGNSSRMPKPETFQKGIYTIDIGQNDIADVLYKLRRDEAIASIPAMIDQVATAIKILHYQGARVFWVHNTGPIGCLPYTLTYVPKNPPSGYLDENGCIRDENEVAHEFNKQLKDTILDLRIELSDAVLTYVDVYAAKYGLISDAANQGFGAPAEICCGYFKDDIRVRCANRDVVNGTEIYGEPCANPSSIISWDGVHYTEAANKWLATRILNGSYSDPPIPFAQACQGQQKL
ncbi:unnamed protein product [Rhodiola kirilowii]